MRSELDDLLGIGTMLDSSPLYESLGTFNKHKGYEPMTNTQANQQPQEVNKGKKFNE